MKPVHLTACLAIIISACGGNGAGLDANGRPLMGGGGTTTPPLSADFDSIQDNVFTPICSVCHAGGGAPEGLSLAAGDSYALLVGVPSTEVPSLMRVKPGDPNNSYIIQKLEGHAAVGAQMPDGCPQTQPCLPATTIAFIAQWITNGAPASTAAAPASFAVTAMVPDGSETVTQPPPQIMIAFNHELDITQLDAQSARIERMDSQSPSAAAEVIPARLSVSSANLKALMIWPAKPLSGGQYRVVFGAGASQVTDTSGQSIMLGTPNQAGESVITTFDVEVLP